MQRETCGGCNSTNLKRVLDLGASPLADEYHATVEESVNAQRYPLMVVRCHRCTLVQLEEIVPDDLLWRQDYGFYTGSSWVAARDQQRTAAGLISTYPALCERGVVEVACNDGTMLRVFAEHGYPVIGIDPAKGPAQKAREAGLYVFNEPFTRDTAAEVVSIQGRVGLILANNVIAHVIDPNQFMAGIRDMLWSDGVAIFEFQYLADLITGNQFDHVYHEHRSFFDLTSFIGILLRHGLRAHYVEQIPAQGGSLRVYVSHARSNAWKVRGVDSFLADEEWLSQDSVLDGFQGRVERIRTRLVGMIEDLIGQNKIVAGYGASAKAATLANFCGLNSEEISYFTDTTPTKHGKYLPGTNIPIIDPSADSRAPDVYLLTVWNYASAVMRRENFNGQWLLPIPAPVLL